MDEFKQVNIWRSIEVLYEACRRGILMVNDSNSFIKLLKEFEYETGHKFRRKEVLRYARKFQNT